MSQYPIHVFAAPDGTWYPASETDQRNVSLEAAKRVRTRTLQSSVEVWDEGWESPYVRDHAKTTILVSAGLWWPSQLGFKPFKAAVGEAALEAKAIAERGGFTWVACEPWASREETKRLEGELRVRNPIMHRALWLCGVKGYSITAALRVLGHPKPETNGRRQLQRLVKSAKAKLEELRSPMAAPQPK